jgi:hypothetical protein
VRSRLALVVVVAVAAGGCGGHGRAVSHGAGGSCVRAWNASGNAANRKQVVKSAEVWKLQVSGWARSQPAPESIGRGCSYFFFTDDRWVTFSGSWESDGDLRWGKPPKATHSRTPEQRIAGPNARLESDATIRIDPWQAVINDWFDDGRIDHRHSCAAARAAVEHLPADGPEIGATVRAYERKNC